MVMSHLLLTRHAVIGAPAQTATTTNPQTEWFASLVNIKWPEPLAEDQPEITQIVQQAVARAFDKFAGELHGVLSFVSYRSLAVVYCDSRELQVIHDLDPSFLDLGLAENRTAEERMLDVLNTARQEIQLVINHEFPGVRLRDPVAECREISRHLLEDNFSHRLQPLAVVAGAAPNRPWYQRHLGRKRRF